MSDFETMRAMDMSALAPEEWRSYYAAMAPWLKADDAQTRESAVERLAMAVFRGEPIAIPRHARTEVDDARSIARLDWLLAEISGAHERHSDIIPAFLKALHYHGDRAPFAEPLARWLGGLASAPPSGVDRKQARGVRLLVQPFESWTELAARLLPILDHPATYPRACAARRLGDGPGGKDVPTEEEVVALVVEKELARPGVLGPFWSTRHDVSDHPGAALWLLDILERRAGWPPAELPFNDIDFYLHELCSTSPHLVRRMLDNGFEELAWLTATEHAARIEGMEPLLRELACSADPRIAGGAAWHLANHYGAGGP